MKLLVYSGGWEGFLTGVFEAFARKGGISLISDKCDLPGLFDTEELLPDTQKAIRVEKGIRRLSSQLELVLYRAWLSEKAGIDDDITETLRIGFRENIDPLSLLIIDSVKRVVITGRHVGMEAHRFLGLVRFIHVHNDLYAGDLKHDYNLLPLMGEHFYKRFNNQRIILRDRVRRTALLTTPDGWGLKELTQEQCLEALPSDGEFEKMWKLYFQAVANPARYNKKLQQKFVPLKYRDYITEFH